MEVNDIIQKIQKEREDWANLDYATLQNREDDLKTGIIFAKAASEKLNEAMFDANRQQEVYGICQNIVQEYLTEENAQDASLLPVFWPDYPTADKNADLLLSYLIWPDDEIFLSDFPSFLHQEYVKATQDKLSDEEKNNETLDKDLTAYYGRYGNPQYLPYLRYDYLKTKELQAALNDSEKQSDVYKHVLDLVTCANCYRAVEKQKMLTPNEQDVIISYALWAHDAEFLNNYEARQNGDDLADSPLRQYGNKENIINERYAYIKSSAPANTKQVGEEEKEEIEEESKSSEKTFPVAGKIEFQKDNTDEKMDDDYAKLALAAAQKIKDLGQENRSLKNDLTDLSHRSEEEISSLKKALSDLTVKLSEQQEEHTKLYDAYMKLDQDNKSLTSDLAARDETITKLKDTNAAKDDQIAQAEASMKIMQQREENLTQEIAQKDETITKQNLLIEKYRSFFTLNANALDELRNALNEDSNVQVERR